MAANIAATPTPAIAPPFWVRTIGAAAEVPDGDAAEALPLLVCEEVEVEVEPAVEAVVEDEPVPEDAGAVEDCELLVQPAA
jgi:hypothetical protein